MRLDTFQALIKQITEKHKAGVRFFTGLEKDFDPANEKLFPAVLLVPVSLELTCQPPEYLKTYKLQLRCLDILPMSRTTDEVNKILHKTQQVLENIILKFNLDYGFKQAEVTFNNLTERADFALTSVAFEPFIDDGANNLTGWQADFTFREGAQFDACCVDDQFT